MSRYLYALVLSAVASFGVVWLWILAVPIAFMDPEYASWHAKQIMLERCDLGEVIVLGDSRAAVDVIPALLPIKTTNFAVGGGEPVEAYAVLTRALACPAQPKLVIMSFDPGHFARPDLLWERSVRFGLLSAADLTALCALSAQNGDFRRFICRARSGGTAAAHSRLARGGPLSAAVFRQSHAQFRFGALVAQSAYARCDPGLARPVFLRNRGRFRRGRDRRPSARLPPAARAGRVVSTGCWRCSTQAASKTRFAMPMPVNEATWAHIAPSVRVDFRAYLGSYASRYKRFHVVDDFPEHWPDRFFGDQFCHLNPAGADRLSALLAQRLQAAPPSTQNEAQNGWFNDTGSDASPKVEPSSKRGS